ncbi:hypothetical protein [Corallococcus exiguus]|uniref:hypothetical protein n=1 Tax=Corallococcus exiguus TaxID=83462 RepID=UPI0015604B4A|nr:hypothetical protein [Corallococcus exiguus]NRD58880.1 hypothetical protein [Corallococcus exiguus]
MEHIKEVVAFLVGLGTGLSINVVVKFFRSSNSGATSTTQSNNNVGGSMAGRDISTNKRDE